MPKSTATITEVKPRQISTQKGQATLYEVTADDGRLYTTFDKEWLEKAGTRAEIEYEEVKKSLPDGRVFVNYRIVKPRGPTGAAFTEIIEILARLEGKVDQLLAR